ncbi:MAG: hypothetical protein K8F52_06715 [Candidatus Scalindua rubra]|nr:hypothetical protein [Candidatus Scalindua rubra]TWU34041.1 hypothetical protein S225a_12980 [Candidatus Brocadiaceae bacterium S225]
MSHKKKPFPCILFILAVLFMVVPLCGCNKGIKRFVKNELSGNHNSNDVSAEKTDIFGDNVEVDRGVNERSAKDEVKSQGIIPADKNKREKRYLKSVNKEPFLTEGTVVKKTTSVTAGNEKTLLSGETNSVSVHDAGNGQRNEAVSVEDKIKNLVSCMAMAVPVTEKLKVSIVEFPNFDGETTDFTRFLYEELVVSFASDPKFEVVDRLHTIIGKDSEEIDAIVTGSIMDLHDSVKINARLMLKKTGLVLTAVSTTMPKDKAVERLIGKKRKVVAAKATVNSLYSQIDDLARQIVDCLQQGERYKIVLLEFTELNGRTNAFSRFLSQELVTRIFIADSKRIVIVDNNLVGKFVEEHNISLDELTYPEFSKQLFDSLGVNIITKGVITDLGNSIKLNARILTAETGSLYGVAAIDIVKDEKLAKLMGENVMIDNNKVEAQKIKIKEGHEKASSSFTNDAVFFKEDFSTCEEGQPLPEWGEGLIVKRDKDNKYFLTSDVDNFSVAAREVDFPEEFFFEFEVKGNTKYWSSIRFKDIDGDEFQVSFRLFQNLLSVTLPGPKQVKTEVDINNYAKIKIIRKNKLYELHANGSLLIVGSYSKYKEFRSFEIHSAFSRFQFTGFIGNNLVEN